MDNPKVFIINKDTPFNKITGPDPQVVGKLLEAGMIKENLIMIIEITKPDDVVLKQITSQKNHITIYVEPLLYCESQE